MIRATVSERFWAKVVESPDGCWLWTGSSKIGAGYGNFRVDAKRVVLVHRWAYAEMVGEIPEGLTIDHLCQVKLCVNPEHLEAVSHTENVRRMAALLPKRTHCVHGHEFTGKTQAGGYQRCGVCAMLKARKRRAADKANQHSP